MKHENFIKSSFFSRAAFFLLLTMISATALSAQTVNFAQFIQRNGTQDFVFTNAVTSGNFQTVQGGSPVLFTYQNVVGLPAELQGVQFARIFITAATTETATTTGTTPPRDVQQFNQTFTIQIIRDTPATPGNGTGTLRNLLTAVVTPNGNSGASLSGDSGSNAAAFTASSSSQNVLFTSDFLGFLATNSRNLGLSFSSIIPNYSIGPGGFLNSFTSAGTGTFAANPVPIFNPPTAAGVTVSGQVFASNGEALSRATVVLTESSGASRTITTNSFGRFEFSEISAGQIVTVSIISKRYSFATQVFETNENVTDIVFTAQ